jgi:hypothetical protein
MDNAAVKGKSDWSMEIQFWKAELKYASTMSGEQSVMTCGTLKMLPLLVGNLDSQLEVH